MSNKKQAVGPLKLNKADIQCIAEAVCEIIEERIDVKLDEKFDELVGTLSNYTKKEDVEKVKCNVRVNRYDNDRLEQYTRRENIRIHNFSWCKQGKGDESLCKQVVDLLNHLAKMEANAGKDDPEQDLDDSIQRFVEADISTCHPVGKKPGRGDKGAKGNGTKGGKHQIIVRFVSRSKVMEVFRLKKNLKKSKTYENVYITDDLTSLRMKLRDIVRNKPETSQVFTRDGNIHCTYKGEHVVISTPDDLFNVDIPVDLQALGLGDLV